MLERIGCQKPFSFDEKFDRYGMMAPKGNAMSRNAKDPTTLALDIQCPAASYVRPWR